VRIPTLTNGRSLGVRDLWLPLVLAVVVLLVAIRLLTALSQRAEEHGAFRQVATVEEPEAGQPIPAEMGPFRDLLQGRHAVAMGEPSPHVLRPSREVRASRRAYDGAPPIIPHVLGPEAERDQDCGPCHDFGGYNPILQTYTPRSPHPELRECMQCHLPRRTASVFAESDWVGAEWPRYGEGGAVIGAPPTIKHPLQMREHCLACHGGGSAAPDIRTDHSERFNCRQCHVPIEAPESVFRRPIAQGRDQ
jgi:cytochrome c-type protein NapB